MDRVQQPQSPTSVKSSFTQHTPFSCDKPLPPLPLRDRTSIPPLSENNTAQDASPFSFEQLNHTFTPSPRRYARSFTLEQVEQELTPSPRPLAEMDGNRAGRNWLHTQNMPTRAAEPVAPAVVTPRVTPIISSPRVTPIISSLTADAPAANLTALPRAKSDMHLGRLWGRFRQNQGTESGSDGDSANSQGLLHPMRSLTETSTNESTMQNRTQPSPQIALVGSKAYSPRIVAALHPLVEAIAISSLRTRPLFRVYKKRLRTFIPLNAAVPLPTTSCTVRKHSVSMDSTRPV